MDNFKSLGVQTTIVKGLTEINIIIPSEIQKQVIPILLEKDTDLIGQAQTGTGKTAAFGLPLLQKIKPQNKEVQALILCPTRELSKQIAKQLFKFTKYTDKIFVESVYGGENIDKQIKALNRPTHVIVATPGRLIDLVNRKAVDLSFVKTIVLDEADEMLSMGFKKELDQILNFLTEVKNKWLFSATMPQGIKQIVNEHLSESARRIQINKHKIINQNIQHQFIFAEDNNKLITLLTLLQNRKNEKGVIFCKTKTATQKLVLQLKAKNIKTDAIHGNMTQKDRDKVMRGFKKDRLDLLVATDLAARGIDIRNLSFVFHYQLPDTDEYYTHRSGRTARAGNTGKSIVIANENEIKRLKNFEQKLNIKFEKL